MAHPPSPSVPSRWETHLQRIGAHHGSFARLDPRHAILFVEEGQTLLLTFDHAERFCDHGEPRLPLGFDCVRGLDHSLLSVIGERASCFGTRAVTDLLSTLASNGFFDSFQQVVIVSTGSESTSAAVHAASLLGAAPLLLVRPKLGAARATPRKASAPTTQSTGLAAQGGARTAPTAVFYDPVARHEAARARALIGRNTTHIALPHSGGALQRSMARRDVLVPVVRHLSEGTLDAKTGAAIVTPALQRDPGYLARITAA